MEQIIDALTQRIGLLDADQETVAEALNESGKLRGNVCALHSTKMIKHARGLPVSKHETLRGCLWWKVRRWPRLLSINAVQTQTHMSKRKDYWTHEKRFFSYWRFFCLSGLLGCLPVKRKAIYGIGKREFDTDGVGQAERYGSLVAGDETLCDESSLWGTLYPHRDKTRRWYSSHWRRDVAAWRRNIPT